MPVTTLLTILSIVNGLLSVAKTAPEVLTEARSLMAKVEPHIQTAGVYAATEFEGLWERLNGFSGQ